MAFVTLLTDFGTTDSYVAEMKGVLLSSAPAAVIIDVSHGVSPGDIRSAAYILGRTWHRFPPGTIHIVVIDPGVGSARAALALRAHGHYFIGPDNGVFTPVLKDTEVEAVTLCIPEWASPTFHGRDLFAPAAAALASGTSLASLGEPFSGIPHRLAYTLPHHEGKTVVGEVVYIDRFGSLITDLTADLVRRAARVELEDLGPLKRTFQRCGHCRAAGLHRLRRSDRDRGALRGEMARIGVGGRVWAGVE
jgi:S-adenosyl-L-methionine hydrolase (adenosine-forming)